MSLHRCVVVGIFLCLVLRFPSSDCWAQSLSWSARYHGGDGIPATWTVGPPSVAVDGGGTVYALALGYNGTEIGLLTKYSAVGYEAWSRIERDGWPLALTADDKGRPVVLTPYRTLAYDADGNVRWRAEHVFDQRYVEAGAIAPATDGGVYVAGPAEPSSPGGGRELGLMRLDEAGHVVWLRTQKAPDGEVTRVDAMGIDRAGRAYVAGRSPGKAGSGTVSFYVAAFAADGSPLWSRWFPGIQAQDRPVLAVDANGGACLSMPGGAFVDFHTVKLDAGGGTAWSADTIASLTGFGKPFAAAVSGDGGLYLAGLVGERGLVARHDASGAQRWSDLRAGSQVGGLAVDPWGRAVSAWSLGWGLRVIAYEASGAVAWLREQWEDPGDGPVWAGGVLATPSGRVLVAAQGTRQGLSRQYTLAFGPTGYLEFNAWPLDVPSADWARSAHFDADGNALVLATGFAGKDSDWILKYDRSGTLLWSREPFADPDPVTRVRAIAVGPAGESVAVGDHVPFTQPRVAKLDAGGSTAWIRADVLPAGYERGGATGVVVDARGAVYVAGWASTSAGWTRLFLDKYSPDGQLLWSRLDGWEWAFSEWPVLAAAYPGDRVVVGGTVWVPEKSVSSPRIWVVDSSGADVWTATPAEPGAGDTLTALASDSSGAVVAGTTFPGRVHRFGPTGALEWTRSSPDLGQWAVNALAVDANHEITVAYGGRSCVLDRLSPDGERQWWKPAEYPVPSYCAALAARPAGGFFVAGGYLDGLDPGLRGYVAAYDAEGHVDWSRDSGAWEAGGSSALNFLAADASGRLVAAGYAFRGVTDYDALTQVVTDEPRAPLGFFTVPPCRVVDTREAALGGPLPLAANSQVEVPIAGRCGVSSSARAVALNVTAVAPSSAGHVTAFAAGRVAPLASVLNHGAGATRASLATLHLGDEGKLALRAIQASGSVHIVIDVAGYFE